MSELIAEIDRVRERAGFWPIRALMVELGGDNVILDPVSTMISRGVGIGRGNRIYPGTLIEVEKGGAIEIGDGNRFYPGCCLRVGDGVIRIGSDNQFGEGGFTATSDSGAIVIGDHGRYMLGANVRGSADLGCGTQLLGPLAVQNCVLEAGGGHQEPDPDQRGAVLKGQGRARNLRLRRGEVILGIGGDLDQASARRQTAFHPTTG